MTTDELKKKLGITNELDREWNIGYGAAMYVIRKCKAKTHSAAISYYKRQLDNYNLADLEENITKAEFLGSNFKRIMMVQIEYHTQLKKMFGNKIDPE